MLSSLGLFATAGLSLAVGLGLVVCSCERSGWGLAVGAAIAVLGGGVPLGLLGAKAARAALEKVGS